PPAGDVTSRDDSTHLLREPAHERQPDPRPLAPSRELVLAAIERLEDPSHVPLGDPRPVIADDDADRVARRPTRERDPTRAAVRRILDRVVDQVEEHLQERVAFVPYGWQRLVHGHLE